MPLFTRQDSHAPGDFLGRTYDFWTLLCVDADGANLTTQAVLDRVVEVISLNGQPVLLGSVTAPDGSHHQIKFATEHSGAWTATTMLSSLISHGNYTGVNFTNSVITLATGL